jgi:RNA polymerase sigma factor (sigma-70 family)
MSMGHRNQLLDQVRRAAFGLSAEQVTDGELLDRFLARREEAAFEALVRRHGPMVLGVCQRVIGNCHDAEDAFQATFLVLVRKAGSIRPREAVGNWLYGVAYRTALEARGRIARRRFREKQVAAMPHPAIERDEIWQELRSLLDRELNRLSEKYRLPVVLCDLEGRSRKEVARQLAIPEGTLSSRLASARKTLARRLARHGLGLSVASLAALLAGHNTSAAVPAAFVATTIRAAMFLAAGQAVGTGAISLAVTALMEGVLKTMLLTKLKTATTVLCGVMFLGIGGGGLWYQARAGGADSHAANQGSVGEETVRPQIKFHAEGPLANAPQPGAEPVAARTEPQASNDSAARLEQMQEELARARREVEDLTRQLETERSRAEEYQRQSEAVSQQMQKRLEQADEGKQALAQRLLYANQVHNAAQQWEKAVGQRADLQAVLKGLEEQKRKMLADLQAKRTQLAREMSTAEDQYKREVEALDQQEQAAMGMLKAVGSRGSERSQPASGDKLDRILERLEAIEHRLGRLESKSVIGR